MPSQLNILLLEDSEEDTEMLQHLLRKEMGGVSIRLAGNKTEYLEALNLHKPDVILADNSLPQFSATEALMTLRHRSQRIPFILVTGTVSEEFAAGIIKLGADDYLLKDRMTRLPSAIDAAIKQCKAENDQQETFAKLIQSEENHRKLIERITDAFIALDKDMRYTYVNKQAGVMVNRDPSSLLGKYVWDEFPDAIGSATYLDFHRALADQCYILNTDYYAPLDLWQENHIYPSSSGLSVFIRDITHRKKAEIEILQINTELRQLSSHLQQVREEERLHIAREIHDELGQQLTGLKMELHWLQKKMTDPSQFPLLVDKIKSAIGLVDETVKSVRRIVSDLRPSILDDLGIVAALEWQSEQAEKRFGIVIRFTAPVLPVPYHPIQAEISTGLFRIYQEVLTNAVRHANAKTIHSSLQITDTVVILAIRDDGIGMNTGPANQGTVKTWGLLGIKERTAMLGGMLLLHSEPGKGTEITITIPIVQT